MGLVFATCALDTPSIAEPTPPTQTCLWAARLPARGQGGVVPRLESPGCVQRGPTRPPPLQTA